MAEKILTREEMRAERLEYQRKKFENYLELAPADDPRRSRVEARLEDTEVEAEIATAEAAIKHMRTVQKDKKLGVDVEVPTLRS